MSADLMTSSVFEPLTMPYLFKLNWSLKIEVNPTRACPYVVESRIDNIASFDL